MKKAKLLSVIFALVLLCACVAGVCMTGTTAATNVRQMRVDGTTYNSVKAVLNEAASKSWAANDVLVITVDPTVHASESISHDETGVAYAGGIAFGHKTIFRADGTRLPITIQGSSADRTAFTLNIKEGSKIACANSFTFKDLFFPIGDSSVETYFYAGSGIVRLENVATSATTGVKGWIGGDNFTARAYAGWTKKEIAANSDSEGKILSSMCLGNNVEYVHGRGVQSDGYKSRAAAVQYDGENWTTYEGVTLTPRDTKAEIVLDGATVGFMLGRNRTSPVAESIQRVENGTIKTSSSGYFGACGTHYTDNDAYGDRVKFEGDVTVIINGGTFASPIRLLWGAEVDGDFTVEINGGTFNNHVQTGRVASLIKGDFALNVTGGTFNDSNGLFCYPQARIEGESQVTVSGGTFKGFRASRNGAYDADGKLIALPEANIEIIPNATDPEKSPVFQDIVYIARESGIDQLNLKISGGTFRKNVYLTSSKTISNATVEIGGGTFEGAYYSGPSSDGSGAVTRVENTVSGGTFNGNFYGGGDKGTYKDIVNVVTGGTFNGCYMGGGKNQASGNVENRISGGTFNSFLCGAGASTSVNGNVTNKISGGTFTRPVYGGSLSGSVGGTVTNELCGPVTFSYGFCGVQGTDATGGTTGAVVNRVYADENGKAPTFRAPKAIDIIVNDVTYKTGDSEGFSFLGGTTNGSVTGTVTNTVEAGTFGTSAVGMYKGGNRFGAIGKDESGVSIYNNIKGGTFNFRFYGGNVKEDSTHDIAGEIRTVIEGGVFKKEVCGGIRHMDSGSFGTPVVLTVRGGEFLSKVTGVYWGYNQSQSASVNVKSAIVMNLEGGVFRDGVYGLGNGGTNASASGGSGIAAEGSVAVNVYGGTFYGGIFSTNETPYEAKILGTAKVNVEPKCGDVLLYEEIGPRFEAEQYVLTGADHKILVDVSSKIEATSATGTVHLEQVNMWKNATYLTLPAGHTATVNVTTGKDAYGYFETVLGESGEVVEVRGTALKVGASMILTDRIALKFQLSKEAVDAVESFTYSFTLPDGTVLAEGTKADLQEVLDITGFEYYTLTLKALGIGQFDTLITANVKGVWENDTFSISTLATAAVTAWEGSDSFVLMAKAIVNMAKAAKGEAVPYLLTPDEVIYERKTPTRDEAALVSFTDKSLLMSSAVGVRLSGTVANAADAEGLVVKVNGGDVTAKAAIRTEVTGVTVDLYFTAYGMSEEFKLEILDKNGKNCLTMYERLDSFATQYGTEHALAQALLSYVQATSAMTKATPVAKASQEEIAYLNGLYAGESIYYGDIHGHPAGGIIKDGTVSFADWSAASESLGVDFYTAMNHKQVAHMYDTATGWDPAVFIGGSEPEAYIKKEGKTGRYNIHFNMLVPSPEDLIEVLKEFEEFKFTGGKDGVEDKDGTFIYPFLSYERFNELVTAIKERGGTVVNVHPKQLYVSDDPLDYYYQDYMGLEVFYSDADKDSFGPDSLENYELWCELLAMGKRVWATAGSDSHADPENSALTALYSSERINTKYLEKIASGNFSSGYAGIRMAIGETEMGGHTDFAGKKLIFSVGDFHEICLDPEGNYRVNVITDQGVVFSTVVKGNETSYFSLDADENAEFYRIEVLDETLRAQKDICIVGLGNPIWND